MSRAHPQRLRLAAALALALLARSGAAQETSGDPEPWIHVEGLRNGDFELPVHPELGLPYWKASGAPRVERVDGRTELVTASAADRTDAVAQPIAFYAPLGSELVVRGRVRGRGEVALVDGSGGRIGRAVGGDGGVAEFEITARDVAAELGRAPEPRLVLHLRPANGSAEARWSDLSVRIALPCPSEDALRAELLAEIQSLFASFGARALDDLGPRRTAFLARDYDADTGAPLKTLTPAQSIHPFALELFRAWEVLPLAEWTAELERYLADLLELGLNPGTGLPREWDPERDVPIESRPIEIRQALSFLLDVAERGPAEWRARARAAALRMAEHALAHGVLADGQVAARYWPADGKFSLDVVSLRKLDVPSQLVRVAALTSDARFSDAASEALLEFDFTHHWPGTWDHIDPGFDDQYGNFGERAVTMWKAAPAEPAFRHLALSGWRTYAPLWGLALRHGGNLAADQVRCWRIAAEIAELEPALADEVRELLAAATRAHLHGQQDAGGAWRDVTMQGFDPVNLPVGDTGGVPQNLLAGLARVYDAGLGLRTDETRAMFTAVYRETRARYRGPHGYAAGARRAAGAGAANSALGSARVWGGLVEMLRQLSAP